MELLAEGFLKITGMVYGCSEGGDGVTQEDAVEAEDPLWQLLKGAAGKSIILSQ